MLSTLIVAGLTILRIGIPALVLLTLGEVLRRHNQYPVKLRGA